MALNSVIPEGLLQVRVFCHCLYGTRQPPCCSPCLLSSPALGLLSRAHPEAGDASGCGCPFPLMTVLLSSQMSICSEVWLNPLPLGAQQPCTQLCSGLLFAASELPSSACPGAAPDQENALEAQTVETLCLCLMSLRCLGCWHGVTAQQRTVGAKRCSPPSYWPGCPGAGIGLMPAGGDVTSAGCRLSGAGASETINS